MRPKKIFVFYYFIFLFFFFFSPVLNSLSSPRYTASKKKKTFLTLIGVFVSCVTLFD